MTSEYTNDFPTQMPADAIVPMSGAGYAPAPVLSDAGMFPSGPLPEAQAGGVSFKSYVAMLRRYLWMSIAIFVLVVGTAIPLIWFTVVPLYRATAVIHIAPFVQTVLTGYEENGIVPLYASFLNTQVSVIRSPTVLNRVLDLPQVSATDWYNEKTESLFRKDIPALTRMTRGLSVQPRRNTELIDVSITTKYPADAKTIVDSVVEQYMYVAKSAETVDEKSRMQVLISKADSLKAEVGDLLLQKKIISRAIGTDSPEEYRSHITTQSSRLEDELEQLRRRRKINEARLARRETTVVKNDDGDDGEPAESGEEESDVETVRFADDIEWRRLQRELDTAKHHLTSLGEQYGQQHPSVKQAVADIAFADDQLAKREAELSEPGARAMQSMMLANAEIVLENDPEWLREQIALSHVEEEILVDRIKAKDEEKDLVSERAHELLTNTKKIVELETEAQDVRNRLNVLKMEAKAPGRISIMQKAMYPAEPFRDRRVMLSAMAIAAAMGLGVGAAFLRGLLDPSIRHIGDVAGMIETPFLGYLPALRFESDIWEDTPDDLQESMRMIRTALIDRLNGTGSTVLITSCGAQAGKTSVAILLARSFSRVGKKVLLVDADLRRPALAKRLSIEGKAGLPELLNGSASSSDAISRDRFPGVDILPTLGSANEGDAELLANGAFAKCLRAWKKDYDIVLFDSPPILPVADARILAGQLDGAILAIRVSHCRKSDAADAVALLDGAGCRPLGTVFVGADPKLTYASRYAYALEA